MTRTDDDGVLRVAIVGVGPKGLFALERLLHHARRAGDDAGPGVSIDIDLFEPSAVPGAGPVYDPGQPDYLRMNFAAEQFDLWPEGSRALAESGRLSFVRWRRSVDAGGGSCDEEPYPPRAQVGRYLADGLRRMLGALPAGVRVTLRPSQVLAARRVGSRWMLASTEGSMRRYDEVLVAIGHRRLRAAAWTDAPALVPAVFPVARWLSRERVAPGCTVAVRGFALTFVDAALALTEGRGGRFEVEDHPYRLRYVPGDDDVAVILPFSRSGRPMLAKPPPSLAGCHPALAEIAAPARARILALPQGFDVEVELVEILAAAAGASLATTRARAVRRSAPVGAAATTVRGAAAARPGDDCARCVAAARHWLRAACRGFAPDTSQRPIGELERSIAVGAGLLAPDLQWALGHCWRTMYPAVVARLGHGGVSERGWPSFRRLASQLERVGFGPSAINAAKLLALIEAGRVDLTHVAGGTLVVRHADVGLDISAGEPSVGVADGDAATRGATVVLRSRAGDRNVDVVVDAVLPGPGVAPSDGGLVARLLADGHARVAPGRRGLDVLEDAGCVGNDGRRTPGLAAIGRPTEDCVIGNDTLSRTLHPHADRWAHSVLARAAMPARRCASDRQGRVTPALATGEAA